MPMRSIRALFVAGSHLFSGHLLALVPSFLQNVLVVRALGQWNFGLFALAFGFCQSIQSFLTFRTVEALTSELIRSEPKDAVHHGRLIGSALCADLGTSLLSFMLVLLASPYFVSLSLQDSSSLPLFLILAFITILPVAENSWLSLARYQRKFKAMALLPAVFVILQTVAVTVAFLLDALTVYTLAYIYVSTSALRAVLYGHLLERDAREIFGVSVNTSLMIDAARNRSAMKSFWVFMRYGYLSGSITALIKSSDVLLLGIWRSESDVGVYKLAKSLLGILQSISHSLAVALFQDLVQLVTTSSWQILRTRVWYVTCIWSSVIALGVVVGSIVASPVIGAVYGEALRPAAGPFVAMLFSFAIPMALFWANPLLLALKKLRVNLVSNAIVAICFLATSVFFVPEGGAVAMGISLGGAWSLAALVAAGASIWEIYRQLRETRHGA